MTDEPASPTPPEPQAVTFQAGPNATPAEPAVAGPPRTEPTAARTSLIPWLYGFGFLILAAAIFYLWEYPGNPADSSGGLPDIRAIEQKLASLDSRIGRLEQIPAPPTAADLGKISARLDVLEARISDQTQFVTKLDGLSGRIEALTGRDAQQTDKINAQIAALQKASGAVDSMVDRVTKIARIQAAQIALASGKPLGTIPGAPAALTRYATTAPPTEAQLLLAFPDMERAALATNPAAPPSAPFVDRMWQRAQDLVTIRQGDNVVVGNAFGIALGHARVALEAGDLPAAVNLLAPLAANGPKVLAEWVASAKGLLDARAALADLAAHV